MSDSLEQLVMESVMQARDWMWPESSSSESDSYLLYQARASVEKRFPSTPFKEFMSLREGFQHYMMESYALRRHHDLDLSTSETILLTIDQCKRLGKALCRDVVDLHDDYVATYIRVKESRQNVESLCSLIDQYMYDKGFHYCANSQEYSALTAKHKSAVQELVVLETQLIGLDFDRKYADLVAGLKTLKNDIRS